MQGGRGISVHFPLLPYPHPPSIPQEIAGLDRQTLGVGWRGCNRRVKAEKSIDRAPPTERRIPPLKHVIMKMSKGCTNLLSLKIESKCSV